MVAFWLRCIVLILWLFWLIAYWNVGQRVASAIAQSSSQLDKVLIMLIALLTIILLLGGFASLWVSIGYDELTISGAVLTITGITGTFYCRSFLGHFWTAQTAIQHGHQVVDRGPYRVVRHPIYTAAIVMYLGMALTFPVWWAWIAVLLVILAYVAKTTIEDRFLGEQLPGYLEYKERTRFRLFPAIW